jgi:hypothetical protein
MTTVVKELQKSGCEIRKNDSSDARGEALLRFRAWMRDDGVSALKRQVLEKVNAYVQSDLVPYGWSSLTNATRFVTCNNIWSVAHYPDLLFAYKVVAELTPLDPGTLRQHVLPVAKSMYTICSHSHHRFTQQVGSALLFIGLGLMLTLDRLQLLATVLMFVGVLGMAMHQEITDWRVSSALLTYIANEQLGQDAAQQTTLGDGLDDDLQRLANAGSSIKNSILKSLPK